MGQKSLHCPGTKRQQDKLKYLRKGTGQDFDILPWDRAGRNFDSVSRTVLGRDAGRYPGTFIQLQCSAAKVCVVIC